MQKKETGNKGKGRKAAYQLPDAITPGEVLTDTVKKKWKLGTSVGTGGFGEIYKASDDISKPVGDDAPYVVKIEPHGNGPLFTEIHFYTRAAKDDMINEWIKKKILKSLGMPRFIGNGSHEYKGVKYRFMVMERFGGDLQKLFESGGKKFSVKTILTIGIKIMDVLEYIHHTGYVHADIKGSNLLQGPTSERANEIYLVDYGLACRYISSDGEHKEYKKDPKKAHNGTIEFTSRDAHIGANSRRGDLEILAYNMLQWCCGELPWEDNLKDQNYVHREKERYMKNIPSFVKKCCKTLPTGMQDALQLYLDHVASLDFTTKPDYNLCKDIFKNGLKKSGLVNDGKLEFARDREPLVKPKSPRGRKVKTVSSQEYKETENINLKPSKAPRSSPNRAQASGVRKPAASNRSQKNSRNESKEKVDSTLIDNPTPAMLKLMEKKKRTASEASTSRSRNCAISPPRKKKISTPTKPIQTKPSGANTRTVRQRRSKSPLKSMDMSPELF